MAPHARSWLITRFDNILLLFFLLFDFLACRCCSGRLVTFPLECVLLIECVLLLEYVIVLVCFPSLACFSCCGRLVAVPFRHWQRACFPPSFSPLLWQIGYNSFSALATSMLPLGSQSPGVPINTHTHTRTHTHTNTCIVYLEMCLTIAISR